MECDRAVANSEDRVIFAQANAFARPEFRAALTDDDIACDGFLATEQFYTKTTASAVATVAG